MIGLFLKSFFHHGIIHPLIPVSDLIFYYFGWNVFTFFVELVHDSTVGWVGEEPRLLTSYQLKEKTECSHRKN